MVSPSSKRSWISLGGTLVEAALVLALAMIASPGLHAQTPQWAITDPGAGGAFITINVGATGYVYAGSDLSGLYHSTDQGTYWEDSGYFQGINPPDVSAVGPDPTDDDIVLAGTENSLYRSTDEGYDYTLVQSGGYWTSIAIAQSDDEIAYAAHQTGYNTTDGSIWMSTNNGQTWAQVSTDLPAGLRIQKLIVDPTNADIVYFLSQSDLFATSPAQLYKSTNGGSTWTQLGGSNLSSNLLDFAVDPQNHTTIYVTRGDDSNNPADGTYKSTNGGSTFTQVSTHRGIVYVKFDQDSVVNVLDMNADEIGQIAVFQTTNSGSSWSQITSASSFHTTAPSWPTFSYGIGYAYCKSVAHDPTNSSRYYWAGKQWVYISSDGMADWYPDYTAQSSPGSGRWKGAGISNSVALNISISEDDNNLIYAGYADLGLWLSTDGGDTWADINDPNFTGSWDGNGGDAGTVLADPVRESVVWAANGEASSDVPYRQLIKSTNTGAIGSWALANTGLPTVSDPITGKPSNGNVQGMSLSYQSSSNNRTLYVCDNGDTYQSTNDGTSWAKVLFDGNGGTCNATAVDRANGNYVYSGGNDGFWYSTNGGANWTKSTGTGLPTMGSGLPSIQWIAIDNSNPTWVYVTVFGSGQGLYLSKNNGQTWTKLLKDDYLREAAVDPHNAHIIFVTSSRDFRDGGSPLTSTGVQRSTDGGVTWTQYNQGLSFPMANALAISSSYPQWVFIGTPGNAFQRADFPDD